MYIVAVNGSPSKNGNTVFLLQEVLKYAEKLGAKVEMIHAMEAVMSSRTPFCVNCSSPCNRSCYKGTAFEEEIDKLKKADAIVIGSPVYFGSVSAQLKAFFDKMRDVRAGRVLVGKKCAGVACGHSRFGGQETTLRAIHDIALVLGMTIVGDGIVEIDAGHHGVCSAAPAAQDEFAIKRAEILAKRLMTNE